MESTVHQALRAVLEEYADAARAQARPLVFEHWALCPPTLHERMADAGVVPCTWVP